MQNIIKLVDSACYYTSSFITLNETVKALTVLETNEEGTMKKQLTHTERTNKRERERKLSLQPTGKNRVNSVLPQ